MKSPHTQPQELRAGPLACLFEPCSGFLRCIRMESEEVLRGIYAAVRDRNWNTVPAKLTNLSIQARDKTFHVSFHVECCCDDVDFQWLGQVTGQDDGTIQYHMSGKAKSRFYRNRIGFCVLHPIAECAGSTCTVTHVDGSVTRGAFPREISPHQPFKNIRSIQHPVVAGLDATVTLEGDIFEMEDQRNWTDASFKTYCTPLELPFPIEVPAGHEINQTITLTLCSTRDQERVASLDSFNSREMSAPRVSFRLHEQRLPPLGLTAAFHDEPPAPHELERLARLRLNHLRVELQLSDYAWQKQLASASAQAKTLGIPLDIALILSEQAESQLTQLATTVGHLRPSISHWYIFHKAEKSTSSRWLDLARRKLTELDSSARFVTGTNAYFAELNRGRPPLEAADGVCFSINPQVHAFDDTSLAETLEAQPDTVRTARSFCGDVPICVGPITLRPRFNPNATGPEPPPEPGQLPSQVDFRQPTLFAAAWTLASISQLTAAGASRLAYYETTGWCGVMETGAGPPLPGEFHSIPGGVYPVYHVLADIGQFAAEEAGSLECARLRNLYGLILRRDHRVRLLVANVGLQPQRLVLPSPEQFGGSSYRCRVLDSSSVETAMRDPESFQDDPGIEIEQSELMLSSYTVARLDLTMKDAKDA